MSAPTCSDGSLASCEQLDGTAPEAVGWVALEQSGPWGAKAWTQSHLDPDIGRAVEAAAAAHCVRPCLVRRPGRHADRHTAAPTGPDPRTLLVAHTDPRGSWLLEGSVDRPERVLDLDWAALARGDLAAVRRTLPRLVPSRRCHLLVCTNGTRDLCCATKGRPVALALAEEHPDRVWEVTHTSGHRFAATTVLLPAGTLHGRLDAADARSVLDAADRGETVLAGCRGRSTWPAAAQVAELAVRRETGETGLDALSVRTHEAAGPDGAVTIVGHLDGRAWRVETVRHESDVRRAESCGKALVPLRHTAAAVTAFPDRPQRPAPR